MKQIDKLIETANSNPQNLRFREFCRLCEYFEMKKRKKKSGHTIYKWKSPPGQSTPSFTLSIQDCDGFAKPYQVEQLMDWVFDNNLYDIKEKE